MVIKLCFVMVICVVSSLCYSQHWFLRAKPILGSNFLSFQRFEKAVYDNEINYHNGFKPVNNRFFDNVLFKPDYDLELILDFYEINEKWRIGLGCKVYLGSRMFLSADESQNNRAFVNRNIIDLGNSSYTIDFDIGPVDFNIYALATRKLNFLVNNKKNILHFFSLGIGFTKNKINFFEGIYYPQGKFVYESFKRFNNFPFMVLKNEFEFLNKGGLNFCTLAFNYQQGIFKVARLSHYDIFDAGPLDYQSAFTRGSALSVQISKPFYIKKIRKHV